MKRQLGNYSVAIAIAIVTFMLVASASNSYTIVPTPWDDSVQAVDSDAILLNTTITGLPHITTGSLLVVGEVLYGGTNHSNIVTSTDYGQTWTNLFNFTTFGELDASKVQPLWYSHYWGKFFAAIQTSAGLKQLYMSSDEGVSWDVSDTIPDPGIIWSNGITETTTGKIYYGTWGGSVANTSYIRSSTDGGDTWEAETSIITYHIHGMGVGYDGTVYAGYGDDGLGPGTYGVYSNEGGSWANVSDVLLQEIRITCMKSSPNANMFGGHYLAIRDDGTNFLRIPWYGISTSQSILANEILYVDGVFYVSAQRTGTHVDYLWASADEGKTWYTLINHYDETDANLVSWIAGEDGHPYIYLLTAADKMFRIANVKDYGIRELQNGDTSLVTPDDEYYDAFFLANGNYSIPFGRNGIRNPVVEVTSLNLTNKLRNGDFMEDWANPWLYWQFILTTDNHTVDYDDFTRGNRSAKVNITVNTMKASTITEPTAGGKYHAVSFNAKADDTAAWCTIAAWLKFRDSGAGELPHPTTRKQYITLTQEWETYTLFTNGPAPTGSYYLDFNIDGANVVVNQTFLIDEVMFFQFAAPTQPLGHDAQGEIAFPNYFVYDSAKPTRNVSVTIDGTVHAIGNGPYNDNTLISTIALTGDYYDHIDFSASCDGVLFIKVTGERLSYGSGMIGQLIGDPLELTGGGVSNYYSFNSTNCFAGTTITNKITPTQNYLYKSSQIATGSSTGLNVVVTSGYVLIDMDVWDTSASALVTASWAMSCSNPIMITQFTVSDLDGTFGYRVYQDGGVIGVGVGPSFSFTAIGSGDFEIIVWHEKSVSSLVILTVNMVGLGIIVTVLASYIAPIARDIQEKRPIKPEKLTQNLIRTVIFIVVASLMWGVLHSIAIG